MKQLLPTGSPRQIVRLVAAAASVRAVAGTLLGAILLAVTLRAAGAAPPFEWAVAAVSSDNLPTGSISYPYSLANGLGIDSLGNVYLSGTSRGRVSVGDKVFVPATRAPHWDFFLAKLEPSGSCSWLTGGSAIVQQPTSYAGGVGLDERVWVDRGGVVYLSGSFVQDLRIGSQELKSADLGTFVARFNSSGSLLSLSSPALLPTAIDGDGGVHAVGFFAGVMSLVSTQLVSLGGYNSYVVRYSADGRLLWGTTAGGPGMVLARRAVVDLEGNTYALCDIHGPSEIGPDRLPGNAAYSSANPWAAASVGIFCVSPSGEIRWARQIFGSTDVGTLYGIAVDSMGGLFVTAELMTQVSDPGGSYHVSNSRMLVQRYSQSGDRLWERVVTQTPATATVGRVSPQGVSSDGRGGCYVVGKGSGSLLFDTRIPTSRAPFVVRYDSAGKEVWGRDLGVSASEVSAERVVLGPDERPYLSGSFGSHSTGSPVQSLNLDGHTLVTGSNSAAYVARLPAAPQEPPRIFAFAKSLTGIASSNLVLSVAAGGSPVSLVEWRHNGAVVASGKQLTLLLTNIQSPDAGTYEVMVRNSLGSATGVVARLSVVVPLLTSAEGCGTVARAPDLATYDPDSVVTLSAGPGDWNRFVEWSDGVTENPRRLTLRSNTSVSARFVPYGPLETLVIGGVSRTDVVGAPAALVDGEFVTNVVVSRVREALVAVQTTLPDGVVHYSLDGTTPRFNARRYFGPFPIRTNSVLRMASWTGDCTGWRDAPPIRVNIDPGSRVIVDETGGGSVTISPRGGLYPLHSSVVVTAAPDPGWRFLQWIGSSGQTDSILPLALESDVSLRPIFGTRVIGAALGSGHVVVEPGSEWHPFGSGVRITAIPDPGNKFAGWQEVPDVLDGRLEITITNGNPKVTAHFQALGPEERALTVVVMGHGRVIQSPTGNSFAAGTTLQLSAVADSGESFMGWEGDVTAADLNVSVVMDRSQTIRAVFSNRARLHLAGDSFPFAAGGFRLRLTGEPGIVYEFHSSDAPFRGWTTLGVVTNVFGEVDFIDSASGVHPRRLYRAVRISP